MNTLFYSTYCLFLHTQAFLLEIDNNLILSVAYGGLKATTLAIIFFNVFDYCLSVNFNFHVSYKPCEAASNWLTGACSQADNFECRLIGRQPVTERPRGREVRLVVLLD